MKRGREDEEHALYQPIKTGEIEFRDVSFGYQEDSPILKHLSFSVPKGQSIAFVGPTGAGKTTVTSLIARFTSRITEKSSLTERTSKTDEIQSEKNMGFVLQDSFLFQGTIRENIRYGRLDASDKEVEEAAKPPMPTGSSNGSRKAMILFLPKTARASAKDKTAHFHRESCAGRPGAAHFG